MTGTGMALLPFLMTNFTRKPLVQGFSSHIIACAFSHCGCVLQAANERGEPKFQALFKTLFASCLCLVDQNKSRGQAQSPWIQEGVIHWEPLLNYSHYASGFHNRRNFPPTSPIHNNKWNKRE